MIRQEVSVKDFYKIAKENEYFLWHFLQKGQELTKLSLWSIFKENKVIHQDVENALVHILDKINIPYFESYAEDSIDFLMDMGFSGKLLYNPVPGSFGPKHYRFYQPIVMGFHKGKMIANTTEFCYCAEGILDVIGKTNPSLLEGL